jgi:beta-glucosidase
MKTVTKRLLILMFVFLGVFILGTKSVKAGFVEDKPAVYQTDFESVEEEAAAARELNEQIAGEGFVLLKNENDALPLNPQEKNVSVFGVRSDNLILGGGGSGSGSSAGQATLRDSLEAAGFRMNPVLRGFYANDNSSLELPVKSLDGLQSSAAMYNDAAIIVISRTGSEFNDAAMYAVAGHTNLLDNYYSLDDNEKALIDMVGDMFEKVVVIINSAHPLELAFVEDHEGVDSVLWIGHPGINGVMAVGKILTGEVNPSGKTSDIYPADFRMDPTWPNFKGNIQGQLVVGERTVKVDGEDKVVEALFTHYVSKDHPDNVLAPLNNQGTDGSAGLGWDYYSYSRFTDKDGKTVSIDGPGSSGYYFATLDYEEGIYMGYRWYETAKAEGYFNADNRFTVAQRTAATPAKYGGDLYYNRLDGVVYPFGHGLSYTTFDVDITGIKHNDAAFANNGTLNTAYGQKIELEITVKNTGEVPGKKVVQIYYTAPYIAGEIEKSHVALIEFDKTKLLKPGQSEVLKIEFLVQEMASFDHDDKNNNGHAGWELDAGDYVIGVYDSSHVVLDSFTAKVATLTNYDKDAHTGNDVKLRFTGGGKGTWNGTRAEDDLTYYDSRRTDFVTETPWTELTRANFHGTFPKSPTASDLKLTDEALFILLSQIFYTPFNDLPTDPWYVKATDIPATWTQASAEDVAARVDGKTEIQLYDMSGVPFDDPKWVTFLNQLTYAEMVGLISSCGYNTPALASIGKPRSTDQDGPAQIRNGATFWACEVVIASTFNKDLAYKQGLFIGNESLFGGTSGWYAPGANIHRNPASGRNFEYYSQDGVHNGIIAAQVIKGATERGVNCYVKHLFLNDQETSRMVVSTFASEQAIREIYGKPFEYAIKFGGATATMSSFNRIGLLSSNSHYNLYVGLLRDEWGFLGGSVTDWYSATNVSGATGDVGARTFIYPLNTWDNTWGKRVSGRWDEEKNMVVVDFDEDITRGTRWLTDSADSRTSANITANSPVSINLINNRDFVDYAEGVEAKYAYGTDEVPVYGPSAAFKDANNLTTDRVAAKIYKKGDVIESPTQWVAVRQLAHAQLFVQANGNVMQNGLSDVQLEAQTIDLTQATAVSGVVTFASEDLPGATYSVAANSVLPAGLSVNSAGRLTGTPTEAGTFRVRIDAKVAGYINKSATHTINIEARFVFADPEIENGVAVDTVFGEGVYNVGDRYGSGWSAPRISAIEHAVVDGALPAGLVLSIDGALTGVTTAEGTHNAKIQTTLVLSNGTTVPFVTAVQLVVDPAPVIPEPDKVTVTFVGNFEGAPDVDVEVIEGELAAPIAPPYRPGFAFAGWFEEAAATNAFDFSVAPEEDIELFAGWVSLGTENLDAAIADIEALITEINTKLRQLNIKVGQFDFSKGQLIAELQDDLAELNSKLETVEVDSATKQQVQALNQQVTDIQTTVDDAPAPQNGAAIAALVFGIISVLAIGGLAYIVLFRKK